MKEIKVVIVWKGGEREEKQFAKCERAWNWGSDRIREERKRRDWNARKLPLVAFYVGLTKNGRGFGGSIDGADRLEGTDLISEVKAHARGLEKAGYFDEGVKASEIDLSFFDR